MTGTGAIARVGDRIIEYRATAGEKTRILGHLNAEREQIEGDIESVEPGYLLKYKDFSTVADRSPNLYTIRTVGGVTADIEANDFNKSAYLERVLDNDAGRFERVGRLQHIHEKDSGGNPYDFLAYMIPGTTGTGPPRGYYPMDNRILLTPISDAVYTMRLWYIKHYADIADDSDEIEFPRVLHEALIWGACIRERLFRRDTIGEFRDMYEAALARGLMGIVDQSIDGPDQINFIADAGY
jgi:hypothetical protein